MVWTPGCHLLDAHRLESSIDELQPAGSQRLLVPVPLGNCNNIPSSMGDSTFCFEGGLWRLGGLLEPGDLILIPSDLIVIPG